MSGSRRVFLYTDDEDEKFLLELDESNTEAVNDNGVINPDTSQFQTLPYVPNNIKPRYALYSSLDNVCKKRITVLNRGSQLSLPRSIGAIDSNGPIILFRTFYKGESRDVL